MCSFTLGKSSAIGPCGGSWQRARFLAFQALAAALLAVAAPAQLTLAEAIRLEISNFPTWKELQGVRGVPRASARLSNTERWDAQSKPYVRIANESSSPLVGFKLDLSNWDARISAVRPLFGPTQASWTWQDDLQAAMVQFENPLMPGESMVVRLGTAPKAGVENRYRMNQTLFSPASLDRLVSPTGGAVFSMFIDTGSGPFIFDNAGRPVGSGIQTVMLDLQKHPIQPMDLLTPAGASESIQIAPVPEPGAFFLAALAAATMALKSMCRRRR